MSLYECQYCNSMFSPSRKGSKFCSRQCYHSHRVAILRESPDNNPNCRIPKHKAQDIIERYASGEPASKIARYLNVSKSSVYDIVNGKRRPKLARSGCQTNAARLKSLPKISEIQQDVILGSMLGDGFVTQGQHGHARFEKKQCAKHQEYLYWHAEVLNHYSKSIAYFRSGKPIHDNKNKIIGMTTEKLCDGYRLRTVNHPYFSELRKQWYSLSDKTKRVPRSLKLTPRMLAIWLADDGSNHKQHRECYLHTQSFCKDDQCFLIEQLKSLNIAASLARDGNKLPILRISSNSYVAMIQMIQPYFLWDCMGRKTIIHSYSKALK